ncbi:hypothetical protein [Marinobacter piscensis]|uniref:RIFT barrel domain-containing protein n=1 Tax=Marinobacter piscensis TaxID=1562308 RepID=UPI00119D374D|nr:hypothetical protein [Marinobacter piscensis]
MYTVAIRVQEHEGFERTSEPVDLGIPLPRGAVHKAQQLALMDGNKPLAMQLEPLAQWPDGSLRWVHATALVTIEPNSTKDLILTYQEAPSPIHDEWVINRTNAGQMINISTGHITLQSNKLAWQMCHSTNDKLTSVITLSDSNKSRGLDKADSDWVITHKGPVFITAVLKGRWINQNNVLLARFECGLRIFPETGLVQVELTTHNPKRARHPGGLWDLGDPGSVYFRELSVVTTLPDSSNAQVTPQATDENPSIFHVTDFNLYQDSSGGENWQSRNHIGATGQITTQFCGYKLTSLTEPQQDGKRANPLVNIKHECGQLNLAVPDFWQNFPTCLRKEKNQVIIGLFPQDAKFPYELQGGESKTLKCLMAYQRNNSIHATAYTPLIPVIAPECYERADSFPWFKADSQTGALDELIAEGLHGNSNFFAKREIIDEFGWRNFGDIFADHETLYQSPEEPPYISHYNNQYDPIYGFARQFALTGDRRWFQLMDDLARHVVDIDIYHTDEDRAEYNNGLFWHTDHYLDAHTATHRTFSKHNDTSSTPGQTGGGPAEEHCYSTGLLYHYYLTGNQNSREAVLGLARWITGLYEGQSGLLSQMLKLKKREIPLLRKMIKGEHTTTHRYPFTRGTGNYLNTLLDAWLVDGDRAWLEQAEAVIKDTIHPEDQIQYRNLLNIETGWSYLILLSSLLRYLWLKRQMDTQDEAYQYARASVLHYTQWIHLNERPFLVSKAGLEFANDTWVAQDVRKAMILFQASELDSENSNEYLQAGQQWLDNVTTALLASQEAHFTRILVILMQNYGPQSILSEPLADSCPAVLSNHKALPVMTWRLLTVRIGTRMLKGLLSFRPMRELRWLRTRLDRS